MWLLFRFHHPASNRWPIFSITISSFLVSIHNVDKVCARLLRDTLTFARGPYWRSKFRLRSVINQSRFDFTTFFYVLYLQRIVIAKLLMFGDWVWDSHSESVCISQLKIDSCHRHRLSAQLNREKQCVKSINNAREQTICECLSCDLILSQSHV